MPADLVVIGASLGGFQALSIILGGLAADFPTAVVVAQHRAPQSGEPLKRGLQRQTRLAVREAQDKEQLEPGVVYLAPADYHLLLEPGACSLSTEGPVSNARPSVDVLFESAADAYGGRVVGVVLTGANHDGARGAARIKRAGGVVIVQDPDTAESPIMPRAALAAMQADYVEPLERIPVLLTGLCAVSAIPTHAG